MLYETLNKPSPGLFFLDLIFKSNTPSSLFMSDFNNKPKGPANIVSIQPGTCDKYTSIYYDFHLIASEIDFPYQYLMFKCIQLIIRSTCYWDLCRTHYSQKPSNSDDDNTV